MHCRPMYKALIRSFITLTCFQSVRLMAATNAWSKVVLFGDSITQRSFDDGSWGASLASQLQRKCDIVCRGFSGYNTRWSKIILPQIIDKQMASDVSVVTIFFGANDAALLEKDPQQHVPLEEYEQNLQSLVDYLNSVGITNDKIIFIAPPPLDELEWEKACILKGSVLNRKNSVTGEYSRACCKVADRNKIDCIGLWTDMQQDKDWKRFFCDGLHFSEDGARFLDDKLSPLVLEKTSHLPFLYPLWDEVDAKNPESTLDNYKAAKEEL
ncbi:isoamyl acetate-hydrolyzing esterase 1 homolog [Saccoglossus kowalevskii]|uniref:Isoamyl acetate-hydrolyzing esterase 1 homolog n=1 Tax=Saccoglossus kowalevskii TaxID=10224 RepID=A0ABM0GPQ7_SACKO|nr:PREDICTED: isoamyl acetate-hydrolyzing esterase 1 homolog [Saccoglossus kowalevskii]